jgi:hypothetical protein
MKISLRDGLRAAEQVLFRQLDDEAVLLDLKSGTYFGLNDTGARVWDLILEYGLLSDVLDALLKEYAVEPAVAERDLLALVSELVERRLVDLRRDAA